jgi:hypothetical protein
MIGVEGMVVGAWGVGGWWWEVEGCGVGDEGWMLKCM